MQKVLSTAEFQLLIWKFTVALLLQVYPTLYNKSVPGNVYIISFYKGTDKFDSFKSIFYISFHIVEVPFIL